MTANSKPDESQSGVSFLSLAFGAGALAILVVGGFRVTQAYSVGTWPTTDATITSVDIEKRQVPPYWFEPKISYDYEVNGRVLVGDEIDLIGTSSKFEGDLEWVEMTYPVDSIQTVFYNAENPEIVYLQFGPTLLDHLIVVVPLCIVIAVLWDIVTHFRTNRG